MNPRGAGPAKRLRIIVAYLCCSAALSSTSCVCCSDGSDVAKSTTTDAKPTAFEQIVPGSTASIRMLPIPADGQGNGGYWMCESEIPWEVYDIFVFGNADEQGQNLGSRTGANDGTGNARDEPDAVTRPSKPYIPPDRGFGHEGYPAISVSFHGAEKFCVWLSAITGRHYRLPTAAEWSYACLAGQSGDYFFDDPEQISDYVWFWDNADEQTKPVKQKRPNPWGLHDTCGNVAEWCTTADHPVLCGGSYRDDPEDVTAMAQVKYKRAWQMSDPQIPKSQWWLSDCPFAGLRILCELEPFEGED